MAAYPLPQDGGLVNTHVSHLRNYVIDDDRTDDCAFGADDAADTGQESKFLRF